MLARGTRQTPPRGLWAQCRFGLLHFALFQPDPRLAEEVFPPFYFIQTCADVHLALCRARLNDCRIFIQCVIHGEDSVASFLLHFFVTLVTLYSFYFGKCCKLGLECSNVTYIDMHGHHHRRRRCQLLFMAALCASQHLSYC